MGATMESLGEDIAGQTPGDAGAAGRAPGDADAPPPRVVEIRLSRPLGALLTIIAAVVVVWLASLALAPISHLLLLLLVALILAFILSPLVAFQERRGAPRAVAILVAFLAFLAFLVAAVLILIGPVAQQLSALAQQFPAIIQAIGSLLDRLTAFLSDRSLPVVDLQSQVLARLGQLGEAVLALALNVIFGLPGIVFDFLLVLTMTFFLLADATLIRHNLFGLAPERWRGPLFFTEAALIRVGGNYIRGQLLVGLFVGSAAGIGCWLLGVPYPLVIALLAGLLELIPVLGPYLSAIPALLISLPLGFPTVLWVLVLFIIIQQFELNVLGPRITGHAVGLHPLAALLVILSGASLAGFAGALVAVPVAGVIFVLASALDHVRRSRAAAAAGEPPPPLPERLALINSQALAARERFEAARRPAAAAVGEAAATDSPPASSAAR
jgi:predicted PurR-regulated permease PerM